MAGCDTEGQEPILHPVPKGTTLVLLLDALGKDGETYDPSLCSAVFCLLPAAD